MESRVAVLSTRWYSLPCHFLSPLKLPRTFTQPRRIVWSRFTPLRHAISVTPRRQIETHAHFESNLTNCSFLTPQREHAPKLSLYKFGLHFFCLSSSSWLDDGLDWQLWMGSWMLMIRDFENYLCIQKGKKLHDFWPAGSVVHLPCAYKSWWKYLFKLTLTYKRGIIVQRGRGREKIVKPVSV